jgi:hypothetical protein
MSASGVTAAAQQNVRVPNLLKGFERRLILARLRIAC